MRNFLHNLFTTRELYMKRVLILLTVAVFFIIGCSDESGIVTPENQTKNVEWLSFKTTNASHGIEDINTTSITEIIDGSMGGNINFNFSFDGTDIKVKGKLKIPKGAFEGTKEIEIVFNDEFPTILLNPAGTTFQKDLKLSLSYKNFELNEVSPHDLIAFVYIDNEGNQVVTEFQNLIVELNKSKLSVIQAKIPHFSRFGFVKVAD